MTEHHSRLPHERQRSDVTYEVKNRGIRGRETMIVSFGVRPAEEGDFVKDVEAFSRSLAAIIDALPVEFRRRAYFRPDYDFGPMPNTPTYWVVYDRELTSWERRDLDCEYEEKDREAKAERRRLYEELGREMGEKR